MSEAKVIPFVPRERAFYAVQDPLAVEVLATTPETTTIRFVESGYDSGGAPVRVGDVRVVPTPLVMRECDL